MASRPSMIATLPPPVLVTGVALERVVVRPGEVLLLRLGVDARLAEAARVDVALLVLLRLLRLADVYLPLTGQGGFLPKNENGIWNLVGSRMYKPIFKPLMFLEGLKLRRIKKQMLHAAKKGLTFHLWWHPHNVGVHTDFHMQQLEEIFSYYEQLKEKYGMRSLNMGEAAQEVLNG